MNRKKAILLFGLAAAGYGVYTLFSSGSTWTWPVNGGRVTSGFGMRIHPISKVYKMHNGVDIAGETGTEIYAAHDGIVIVSSFDSTNGNFIKIKHDNGFITGYAHLLLRHVRPGQKVKSGQLIAQMGTTGSSTGTHLHFTLTSPDGKGINPLSVIKPA